MDIDNAKERKVLILLNLLVAVVLLMSGIFEPYELIELEAHYVMILRVMSIVSTIFTEVLVFYFYAVSLARTHSELRLLANTDALTNISNRRVLFEQGEKFTCIYEKYDKTFSLMILDIDHFKRINDEYGHPAGDKVLKEISTVISENVRKEDLVCRYGGEEFAILFKNMGHENRSSIENIKNKIKEHLFTINEDTSISLTFSAGVVTYNSKVTSFDELVKKADALLYEAKRTGRDKIIYDK